MISLLISKLRDGGRYLMCENSQTGVNEINKARKELGLDEIIPPWHNRYLNDFEVLKFITEKGLSLKCINSYSSLYYFLSRIVNAQDAKEKGKQPDYESNINKIALLLPWQIIGDTFAQGKIWEIGR